MCWGVGFWFYFLEEVSFFLEVLGWGWCVGFFWFYVELVAGGVFIVLWGRYGVCFFFGCVVFSGKYLEYVNVSGCWREIYNFFCYLERVRLLEVIRCFVLYNVCFMVNEKIYKICI